MNNLKFEQEKNVYAEDYVPVLKNPKTGAMVCCCGYELIKEDEMLWRCTGGSHVYDLAQGDMIKDKDGNMSLRVPEGFSGAKK